MAARSELIVARLKGALTASTVPALVAASAPVVDPADVFKTGAFGRRLEWQEEAWELYDGVGEFKFYVQWVATSCSKARLVASEVDEQGLPTGSIADDNQEGRRVAEIVRSIAGGVQGQSQLIRRTAEILKVPGEVWTAIVVLPGGEKWVPLTREEIKRSPRGDGAAIDMPDGSTHEFNQAAGDGMFRTWNPHARRASEPDSPVRSCLDSLREIARTTAKIANADTSRMMNNGLLMIPQEASLPPVAAPVSAGKPGPDPTAPVAQVSASQQLQQLLLAVGAKGQKDPNSPEALMPVIGSAPGEFIKNIQHITFGKDVSADEIKKRDAAIRRLAMGLDMSPERLTGLGDSNHWCVDEETDALTQRGWLRHSELDVGDVVLTLNHTTGLSEWQPVMDIYRADVINESLVSMESRSHSSMTTLEHRWPVIRPRNVNHVVHRSREFTTSAEMADCDRIPTAAVCADIPAQAKYTDAFVELAAWYWTEGAVSGTRGAVIAQSHTVNSARVDRIRAALTAELGPAYPARMWGSAFPAWTERVQINRTAFGGPVTVFSLNSAAAAELHAVAPAKILDTSFVRNLTRAQLELFIDVSAQGDGQHYRAGHLDMWQRQERAIEAYELALVLSGRMTQRQQIDGGHRVGVWRHTQTAPVHAASDRRSSATVTLRNYSGVVWCPVTENTTWFARRNGKSYFTGNSVRGIQDDDVQLHISPVLEVICHAMYDNVLRGILTKEGIDPDRYALWYDTSRLTADPDLTDEAKDAYQGGAITAEALVRACGLPEDALYDFDTPEGVKVFLRDAVTKDPTLLTAPGMSALMGQLFAGLKGIELPEVAALPAGRGPAARDDESGAEAGDEPDTENTDPLAAAVGVREDHVSMAVDLMVTRALQLAGNRRVKTNDRDQRARLRGMEPHEYHRCMPPVAAGEVAGLTKGWDSGLDEIAGRYGLDANELRVVVAQKARRQLTAQVVDGQVG